MKAGLVIAVSLTLMSIPLHAQVPPMEYEEAHGFRMAMGGLAVGAVGFLVGWEMGNEMGGGDNPLFDGYEEGYWVGSAIGAVGLGLGVHLANRGRGDLGADLLSSLLIGGAGVGIGYLADSEGLMIATVFLQLAVTVHMDKSTARGTYEDSLTRVGLWRPGGGGAGLVLQTTF